MKPGLKNDVGSVTESNILKSLFIIERSRSDNGRIIIRSGGLSKLFRKASFVMAVKILNKLPNHMKWMRGKSYKQTPHTGNHYGVSFNI